MEERSFDPVKTLEAIAQEKCAITYGTPTMWVSKDEIDACQIVRKISVRVLFHDKMPL